MQSVTAGRLAVVLLGWVVACGGEASIATVPPPPPGLPFAVASPDCAPWDGLAVSIYLTPAPPDDTFPAAPFVHVGLWRHTSDLAGRSFRWPAAGEAVAGGSRCDSAGDCAPVTRGRVDIVRVEPDSGLSGALELEFGDGRRISGGFHAVWRGRMPLCG